MLDPWVIEEIKRREDERRREHDQGRVELPIHAPVPQGDETKPPKEESDRGVTVIDL
jgi:hypothetical protein